jgi:SulP family sulfate permease
VTAAIFLLVALAGAFQLAFGLARLARVVKFIPTPVMSGFQIAAAMIIMSSQLPAMLGLAARPAWNEWPAALASAKPLALVVAVIVIAAIVHGARLTKRVPPLVLGVLVGTAAHYLLLLAGGEAWLGKPLGHVPATLPDGSDFAQMMLLATRPGFIEALPAIVLGAASIALVACLDVLMSAKVVENLSGRRGNGTQELVSIGAANLVSPLMGGVAGSISLASTTAGYKGGARNSLCLLVHALAFLALVPLLAPAIAHMPIAVIAGLVFYAGVQLLDRWTLEVARRVFTRRAIHWKGNAIDLAVVLTVACVALAGQIVGAVLIGVAVAIVVFTMRMSRNVIRRERYGDTLQSRRARETGDAAILAAEGRTILAIELGSAGSGRPPPRSPLPPRRGAPASAAGRRRAPPPASRWRHRRASAGASGPGRTSGRGRPGSGRRGGTPGASRAPRPRAIRHPASGCGTSRPARCSSPVEYRPEATGC